MALCFEIKLGSKNKNFDIKNLLSSNMVFGVYENSYYLKEGVVGSPTIIFDEKRIGRGVDVDIEGKNLIFHSPVPSTNSDVELLFKLIQKAIELTKAKDFVFDEKVIECKYLEDLKDDVKKIHKDSLNFFEDVLNDENQKELLIIGATQVVCIGKDKVKEFIKSWDEYENYLHKVQAQDLYFATPMFLENDDEILGLYILTSDIKSSFPLEKKFLVDTKQINVTRWCVGFFGINAEDNLGMISYDDFLANVDTTNMLDAQRFIVKLNTNEMKALIEKYGETL